MTTVRYSRPNRPGRERHAQVRCPPARCVSSRLAAPRQTAPQDRTRLVARRVVSGQAWDEFCDRLKAAGASLNFPGDPQDPFNQAEGYRYLIRLTRAGLIAFVEHADPKVPVLHRVAHETVKLGADNPDNYYQTADLREIRIPDRWPAQQRRLSRLRHPGRALRGGRRHAAHGLCRGIRAGDRRGGRIRAGSKLRTAPGELAAHDPRYRDADRPPDRSRSRNRDSRRSRHRADQLFQRRQAVDALDAWADRCGPAATRTSPTTTATGRWPTRRRW